VSRQRIILLVLLIIAALAVACGGPSDTTAKPTAEPAQPTTAIADTTRTDDPATPAAQPVVRDDAAQQGEAVPDTNDPPASLTDADSESGEAAQSDETDATYPPTDQPAPQSDPPAQGEDTADDTAEDTADDPDDDPTDDTTAAADDEEQDAPAPPPEPDRAPALRILAQDLTGTPIVGAHVVSVLGAARSDEGGFVAPEFLDGGPYHVVAAGYWHHRDAHPTDGVIVLQPLQVRAIYLPYEQLWRPESLEWALGLARDGLINAIVIDIKEEGGAVLPLFATEAVLAIDAVVDPGADMAAFLNQLAALGVYRIARQAVFLDTRLGRSDLSTAILTRGGEQLIADLGLGWTTPFSAKARQYNIEIALAAVPYFEEIQFDYIRFPGGPLRIHEETTGDERSAAIARFARDAITALHAAGAAMSIDTFGETAVIRVEDAIGQVLEDLIPYTDYYSPMLYPSTWPAGSFDLEYPAAHPALIVELSMRIAIARVQATGIQGVRIRPWLQDYRDYQPRMLRYGFDEVIGQIRASALEGGVGFMLWNPTLLYHTDVLAFLRDQTPTPAG